MIQSSAKKQKAAPRSRLRRQHDRLVAMCIVEATAATQSGTSSWKTEPYRLLLRLLTTPPWTLSDLARIAKPAGVGSRPCVSSRMARVCPATPEQLS